MQQVADGVFQLALAPRDGINAWLIGDVLVDAGMTVHAKKIARALAGRQVAAHTVTHAHPDHAGGSARLCRDLGLPFWAPAGDAGAIRAGRSTPGDSPIRPLLAKGSVFPSVPIDRELHEGDDVAGFRVLDTPGHSAGHVAFWRESDRVLIGGDVFFNLSLVTLRPGLRRPPGAFTVDPEQNRRSMERLAGLEPSVACFGHGPPVTEAAPKLRAFVAAL